MLPIHFAARPSELPKGVPALILDGAFPAGLPAPGGGLHLAHWPGNHTPDELRRDLSTEIAFAFLALSEGERDALLNGAEVIALNHYDTDGICALFVLVRPDEALERRELLVETAASGDFHEVRSEHAFCIDAALRGLHGTDKVALVHEALELLGALLASAHAARDRAAADLERYQQDRAALGAALFDDLIYLDMALWTSPLRGSGTPPFDPGRHAFFADGRADRALLLGQTPGGTTARFVIGTRSFFDVVTTKPSPRPDLEALCKKLNEAEGTADADAAAWRYQDVRGASPELWFGKEGLPLYAEHAGEFLGKSRLTPEEIKGFCIDAVRDTWPLPHDDDEADEDEDIFAV
ncbi:hypothetical protein Poly30_20580 [Planctomycetes bacterium Poly30]|uniref:Uncharacterized protein n=1 Tax=Saltatorellus ferox TaxID=2528018 RepID=A0A518ER31_9BACT|nr:hypothetical protein Poly30_20580 [Planctomycetes bacterium Poly30]